jgi:peptidoglycan/LPS O-acetylase OafA/YrhL
MRWRGVLSLLLLVLAWLALDDITTDNATGAFVPEYTMLVVCGIWFAGVAVWLLVRRRTLLGIGSVLAVALAVLAFWSLPHHYGPASPVNYLGLISIAWFLAVGIWLVARRSALTPLQRSEPQPS